MGPPQARGWHRGVPPTRVLLRQDAFGSAAAVLVEPTAVQVHQGVARYRVEILRTHRSRHEDRRLDLPEMFPTVGALREVLLETAVIAGLQRAVEVGRDEGDSLTTRHVVGTGAANPGPSHLHGLTSCSRAARI